VLYFIYPASKVYMLILLAGFVKCRA
jgi:hypothetical protein